MHLQQALEILKIEEFVSHIVPKKFAELSLANMETEQTLLPFQLKRYSKLKEQYALNRFKFQRDNTEEFGRQFIEAFNAYAQFKARTGFAYKSTVDFYNREILSTHDTIKKQKGIRH